MLGIILSVLIGLLSLGSFFVLLVYRQLRLPIPPPPLHPPSPPLFTAESDKSIRRGWTHAFPSSSSSSSSSPPPPLFDYVIIGSGLSGLTCASLLSMRGHRVVVVEAHDRVGGCTHTWSSAESKSEGSQGGSVDGGHSDRAVEYAVGVHYVGGDVTSRHSSFRQLLDLLTDGQLQWSKTWEDNSTRGEMDGVYDVVHFGPAAEGEGEAAAGEAGGDAGTPSPALHSPPSPSPLHTSPYLVKAGTGRWMAELIRSFPTEEPAIRRYVALTLQVNSEAQRHFAMKHLLPLWLYHALAPLLIPTFLRYSTVTTQSYLESLTSSVRLRAVLSYIHFDYGSLPSHSSFAAHCVAQCYFYRGTGYPVGGAGQISKRMVEVIERHGGKVVVRSEVEEVLIDDEGRAVGVRVKGGKEVRVARGGGVVSSVGARRTMLKLIGEQQQWRVREEVEQLTRLGQVEGKGLGQAAAHFSLFFTLEGDPLTLDLPLHNTILLPDERVDETGDRWSGPSVRTMPSLSSSTPSASSSSSSSSSTSPSSPSSSSCAPFGVVFITFQCRKDPTFHSRHPRLVTGEVLVEGRYEWMEQWKGGVGGVVGSNSSDGKHQHHHRSVEYEAMKASVQERLLAVLFAHFPQLSSLPVVHVELGSPLSSCQWLGADKGSSYGMSHSVERVTAEWLRSEVAGVKQLYMTGTDTTMAGLEGATMAGVLTASAIDKGVMWDNLNRIVGARVFRRKTRGGNEEEEEREVVKKVRRGRKDRRQ